MLVSLARCICADKGMLDLIVQQGRHYSSFRNQFDLLLLRLDSREVDLNCASPDWVLF